MRTTYAIFVGLGLGLVLGSVGGFFYLPIVCTIWRGSYDGMGMVLFMMVGGAGGTFVGGVFGVLVGLVRMLR